MDFLVVLVLLVAIGCACFGEWLPAVFFLVLWGVLWIVNARREAASAGDQAYYEALAKTGYFDPPPWSDDDTAPEK